MKKMIGVINDNLRSVVNGIKEHRSDTESSLATIKETIDTKVETASKYKIEVENARSIILSLETEISELENDLKELKEKFGSKNFTEILAAGDKEINSKIDEKKQAIAEQNEIIINITKKAHALKKELTKLKSKKQTIDEDLNKTLILEGYYEKRINAIVDFSIEHPDELATYKEIDEVDDLNTEEIEDIDIGNIIDGQVFNEIDSISEGNTPKEKELKENIDFDFNGENDDNNPLENKDEADFSELDEILNVASLIIDQKELDESLASEEDEDTAENLLDSTEENSSQDVKEEDKEERKHIQIHAMSEPITVNLDVFGDAETTPINESTFIENNGYSFENLSECGLNANEFTQEDLYLLQNNFDKINTLEFIEVLKNHGFDIDKIYTSVGVLLNVTPQNLDKVLTLLESVSEHTDIDYVFRYLDKVNISRLEQNIALSSDEDSLADLLITTLDSENNADLSNLLGITDKEVATIKKSSSGDYQLMINFPEIVLANYNALKAFNIDNLVECVTKFPHRFTINPSKFSAILDKYDPDDLVRCINKNAAVIDKL